MKTHKFLFLFLLMLIGWILTACDDAMYNSADPNVSGVQARATLEYVQAVQTSTAQALYAAEMQATLQAAAAEATSESIRVAAAATQTQQVWSATATADSSVATATAVANATAASWSSSATQTAWNSQATVEASSLRALQTAQAAQADMARMAAERQRTINKIQAAAPWVVLAILVPLVAYLAWLWGNTEALRRRAIPRDPRGDAPILILDGHGRRNVIDPDLFFGAAMSIGKNGQPEAPQLAAPELQSHVKARDQAVDLASRGLPGQAPRRRALPDLTKNQPNPPLVNVRVVEPDVVKDWLSDVLPRIQQQALREGETDDD